MTTIPCPLCGQTKNSKWGSKNSHTLVRCNSCNLIFVSPMPDDTSQIYSEKYFVGGEKHGYMDYDRDKEPMLDTFELYLKHIEQILGHKGKLLDIGCATGYFMDIAKSRGWDVEGIDISEHAANEGRRKGLSVRIGTLESVDLPENSFDAITLLDVMEHLRDPKSAIEKAKYVLKKGGVLVVATPDAGSWLAYLLGPKWHLVVPPEHLVLFNRENFSDLLTGVGFVPLLVTNIGKHFSVPYIFQILFNWQGLSIWNILARITNKGVLSKLKIPINMRDTFFMIARIELDK